MKLRSRRRYKYKYRLEGKSVDEIIEYMIRKTLGL